LSSGAPSTSEGVVVIFSRVSCEAADFFAAPPFFFFLFLGVTVVHSSSMGAAFSGVRVETEQATFSTFATFRER
jgi:hypothetical protein